MERCKKCIDYLKSPELVAEFQKLCKVESVSKNECNGYKNHTNTSNGFVKIAGSSSTVTHRSTNGYNKVDPDELCSKKNGFVQNGNICYNECNGKNGFVKNGFTHNINGLNGAVGLKNGYTLENTHEQEKEKAESSLGKSSFKINSWFYYILFSFGASLGNEMFYLTCFPFFIWNLDSTVLRQMSFAWHVAMYFGQALKDIICWPRPVSPPVIKLEDRYDKEYGMPSTHATVGAVIPFSIVILLSQYYQFPFVIGLTIATTWAILVGCSRIYLGMHTALDVIAGWLFACVIMITVLPWVHILDHFEVTNPLAPLVTVVGYFLLCFVYPKQNVWNTARADTANVHGICGGIMVGTWLNYQLGWMTLVEQEPPFEISPITSDWMIYSALRLLVGVVILAGIRAVFKPLSIHFLCKLYKIDKKDIWAQRRKGSEVPQKFITYFSVSVGASFFLPLLYHYLGILREGFYDFY